jgi:hypothetical protein
VLNSRKLGDAPDRETLNLSEDTGSGSSSSLDPRILSIIDDVDSGRYQPRVVTLSRSIGTKLHYRRIPRAFPDPVYPPVFERTQLSLYHSMVRHSIFLLSFSGLHFILNQDS